MGENERAKPGLKFMVTLFPSSHIRPLGVIHRFLRRVTLPHKLLLYIINKIMILAILLEFILMYAIVAMYSEPVHVHFNHWNMTFVEGIHVDSYLIYSYYYMLV